MASKKNPVELLLWNAFVDAATQPCDRSRALDELMGAVYPLALSVVQGMGFQLADADDVIQCTWAELCKKRPRIATNFNAYFLQRLEWRANDCFRNRKRRFREKTNAFHHAADSQSGDDDNGRIGDVAEFRRKPAERDAGRRQSHKNHIKCVCLKRKLPSTDSARPYLIDPTNKPAKKPWKIKKAICRDCYERTVYVYVQRRLASPRGDLAVWRSRHQKDEIGQDAIHAAIESLPESHRDAIQAKAIDGLTWPALADKFNLTEHPARDLVRDARDALDKMLAANDGADLGVALDRESLADYGYVSVFAKKAFPPLGSSALQVVDPELLDEWCASQCPPEAESEPAETFAVTYLPRDVRHSNRQAAKRFARDLSQLSSAELLAIPDDADAFTELYCRNLAYRRLYKSAGDLPKRLEWECLIIQPTAAPVRAVEPKTIRIDQAHARIPASHVRVNGSFDLYVPAAKWTRRLTADDALSVTECVRR